MTKQTTASPLMANLQALALTTLLLVVTWVGVVHHVDGALNIAIAIVWLLLLPITCASLSTASIVAAADAPPAPRALVLYNRAVRWTVLVLLIWHGSWFTSAAFAFCFALAAAYQEKVKTARAVRSGAAASKEAGGAHV
jgi:hypothetical protein